MINVSNSPYEVVSVVKQNTPNYATLVAKGAKLPVNPYSLSVTRDKSLMTYKTVRESVYLGEVRKSTTDKPKISFEGGTPAGEVGNTIKGLLNTETSSLIDRMNNKMLSKIQGTTIGIGLIYRDRHKTGEMLTKFADDIAYTLRNIKHPKRVLRRFNISDERVNNRNVRLLLRRVKRQPDLGSAFMQYKFAWLPTYFDIRDGLESAAESERKLHTYHVKVKRKIDFSVSSSRPSAYSAFTADMPAVGTRKGGARVQLSYYVSDPSLVGVSNIMNPAADLWDGVPYSFVIDRLVDVGTFLSLQSATIGLSNPDGFLSFFYKDTISKSGAWYTYNPSSIYWAIRYEGSERTEHKLGGSSWTSFETARVKVTSFPSPTLEYPLYQSLSTVIDELILIKQKMKKRRF